MHLAVINHGKQYASNLNALSVSAKMQPRSGHAKTKEIFRSAQALHFPRRCANNTRTLGLKTPAPQAGPLKSSAVRILIRPQRWIVASILCNHTSMPCYVSPRQVRQSLLPPGRHIAGGEKGREGEGQHREAYAGPSFQDKLPKTKLYLQNNLQKQNIICTKPTRRAHAPNIQS